jgi:hypothetical protein
MAWRAAGDGAEATRNFYRDVSTQLAFTTAYTGSDPLISVPKAKYTIFVQSVKVHIRTDSAQSMTIRDSASSPKTIAYIPASPGVGDFSFDCGDDGLQLTEGKDIDVAVSGAGLAGDIIVKAYARIVPQEALVPSDL